MQINSTTPSPMLSHAFKTAGKGSSKNSEVEEKQLDNEIQSLEQKKANLNKEIYSIKGDFAPPKPKEELIRPLKDQIQAINVKIQQKQAEKIKKQTESVKETSSNDENRTSNLEQLNNLTTQTGVMNEAKVKNSLKDSSNLLLKEALSSDVSNASECINSINDKKNNSRIKNAIDQYNLIENGDLVNSTTNMLA